MEESFIKKYTDVEEDIVQLNNLEIERKILLEKKEASITFNKRLTPVTAKRKISETEVKSTDKRVKSMWENLKKNNGDKNTGEALMRLVILDKKEGNVYEDLISFLEKGVPVDFEIHGETPLYAAISLNKKECAKILLDYGASLTKENPNTGLCPLELAYQNKTMNYEIFHMIISKISDLEKSKKFYIIYIN